MNLEILCHPNIPKPLHGLSPRVVYGKDWWDCERQKAYRNAEYCCEACGISKFDALFHQWLEAHEFYEYDYEVGRLKFLKLVALCHSCHNFIHDGHMQMMVDSGKMEEWKMESIMKHGISLLKAGGLYNRYKNRHNKVCNVPWDQWTMEIDGRIYGSTTMNFKEWSDGGWRNPNIRIVG